MRALRPSPRWSLLLLVLCLLGGPLSAEPLRVIQEVDDEGAAGAPFPPETGVQLEVGGEAEEIRLDWPRGRRARLAAGNVSFDRDAGGVHRVYALDPVTGELLVLRLSPRGAVSETRRLRELVGLDAVGLAVDGASDRLFVLESSRERILAIAGFARGARRRVEEIALPANLPPLRGLAFDPASGHLLALAPATGELLELASDGRLLSARQLPKRAREARSIAVASSSDTTDEPARNSLFVAVASESGGTTLELALEPLALAAASTVVPTLVQTVNMAAFSPPSPDPSGVELLGPNGPLLVSDGEVEEMAIFAGVNLYDVALAGNLSGTSSTTFFSDEPTGVARNPANGHLFFSDDTGTRSVYEVTPGADNRVNPGDPVRQIVFASSIDTEGVAYGAGSLWVADGVNAEVRRISPGPNGILENGGDDVISSFDTAGVGLLDPEGIAFDTDGGNLYVVGEPENRVGHFNTSGTLLRWLDTSAANPDAPAGLAYGPGPAGSPTRRLYVVARGQDNGSNPNENDGKLFVFAVAPLAAGNQAPIVSAGPDLAVDLAASASLDGGVADDALPGGPLTTGWSQVSGPGTVSFADASAIDTTATFSAVGSYVVRLTANDGELASFDDAAISVTSSNGATTLEKRVAAGSDDAEQGASGSVSLTSSDLELVADGSDLQTVGLRFSGLAIPPGAAIQSAWIQLQADEVSNVATTLTLQGEASANAAPYTTGANNVGARPRTSASVAWSPPAWDVVGEAGAAQRTPDLSAVVQQIVSGGGWASGNALAFVITGSGSRVAESFEGTAAGAALLHVVFGSGGGGGNLAPTVSAGPDRLIMLGQTAALDGTASDDGQPSGTLITTWSQASGPGLASFVDASAVDTSASFSAPGGYLLRLTAFDGELTAEDEMAVTVIDPNAPGVVEQRISVGSDDAEQRVSRGQVSLTGDDLELVVDGTKVQLVGLRFPDLMIPPGATIQNAWIQFTADEAKTASASLTIQGEASANAAPFAATANNVGARARTDAAVAWTPAAWSLVGEEDAPQRTPSLASVVHEIVNGAGWNPGNAMVFILSGSGTRTAESFEGKPAGAPLLHVEYGPGG